MVEEVFKVENKATPDFPLIREAEAVVDRRPQVILVYPVGCVAGCADGITQVRVAAQRLAQGLLDWSEGRGERVR